MHVRLLLFGLIAMLAAMTFAQHRPSSEPQGYDQPPRPRARVACALAVTLIPDSLLARGELEIAVVNATDRLLSALTLEVMASTDYRYLPPRQRDSAWNAWTMPPETGCVIDSVLFHGVPCDREQVSIADGAMTIDIDPPLHAGARGHLLLSLSVRTDSADAGDPDRLTVWADCWPRVVGLFDSRGPLESGLSASIEAADWRARVKLDSDYRLIHSGRLLNEKELYGVLPRPGGGQVLVDVHEDYAVADQSRIHRPEPPDGLVQYFVDATAETDLILIAGRGMARDMVANEQQRFSAYYPHSRSALWERWLVSDLKRLAAALRLLRGWAPPTEMKAVVVPNASQFGSQSLILVPATSGAACARAHLALGMAGSGLYASENRAVITNGGSNLQRGFAVMMLYAAYGDNASSSIHLIMPSLIQETE